MHQITRSIVKEYFIILLSSLNLINQSYIKSILLVSIIFIIRFTGTKTIRTIKGKINNLNSYYILI